MKISKEQKAENRSAIIRAAVDLISEKGFKSASMRQIAKAAGVGDATIYNYFATKEAILFGYYEDHMQACIRALKELEAFHTFSLQEQLQTLFETSLELYMADREFVAETFRRVLLSGSRDWGRVKPIRAPFLAAVNDMLTAAAEVGEIPEPVFLDLICQLFMDTYIGVVYYWLADRSQGFANTSVLIDRGLDLGCAVLKAGIANKVFDFTIFMFKNHILNNLDFFMQPAKSVSQVKRRFMENLDDR
ncbi:MAG: TetR/AcrR family transcriptional regulator [Desulfobacteraceae bacterium]|jgi:AcrR family transcriptional regulator